MKHILSFLLVFILSVSLYAQDLQISGKITDAATEESLPGVNILIEGTTKGAISDQQGNFTIVAKKGEILLFSYVGFNSERVIIESQSFINVSLMPDLEQLEEVVVVGYGTQKKSDITGSVVSLNSEKLADRPTTNIEQALQGSMAGLTVSVEGSNAEGSITAMTIRGQNSITANNQPLIILDGVPFSGRLSEINPGDIESIEVLKDASSAAIYGARGSNGVILITTKIGKNNKVTVSYETYYTIDKIAFMPDLMDGETFYKRKTEYGETFTPIEQANYDAGKFTDFVEEATQTGHKMNHNLSIKGSTEKNRYFISGSYTDVKGIAINDLFKRYTTRINFEQDLGAWIKLGTNTSLGYYDRSGKRANFSDAFRMNPLGNVYNEDGSLSLLSWEDPQYAENPLNPIYYNDNDISRRVNTNNYLNIKLPFLEGLSYKLNTGFEFISGLNQTYAGRNTYVGNQNNGFLEIGNSYDQNWIIENIFSYQRVVNQHSFFLTALYSAQSEISKDNWYEGQNFPNDVLTYYQPDKAASAQSFASYSSKNHISQMFRANYSYDSRYLFTFTIRRDGFSAFGEDRKFGSFPSGAFGWNIMKEEFAQSIDALQFINLLKFRVSYGVNGNEAITPYSTLPYLSSKNYLTSDFQSAFGFYPQKLGNPTLGWETTRSFNTGFDFGLWTNRVTGLIDMYWSNTTDLLLNKTISPMNGDTYITSNIGETKNYGIEIQFSTVNISTAKFSWRTDFNFASNKTKIIHVGLKDENGNYIDDIASEWFIGEAINVNYDYEFAGIWQESDDIAGGPQPTAHPGDVKYRDTNGDNEITVEDKTIIGSRTPSFIAGMTNTFKYGNFSFSFFLNSIYGVTEYNQLWNTGDISFRVRPYNKNYWSADNPNNEYSANVDRDVNPRDMRFYEDASFLRLQDISFSYRIPAKAFEKLSISNFEVFMNFKNMATWTKWTGLDPEFTQISSGVNRQRATPQLKSYLVGLRLSF